MAGSFSNVRFNVNIRELCKQAIGAQFSQLADFYLLTTPHGVAMSIAVLFSATRAQMTMCSYGICRSAADHTCSRRSPVATLDDDGPRIAFELHSNWTNWTELARSQSLFPYTRTNSSLPCEYRTISLVVSFSTFIGSLLQKPLPQMPEGRLEPWGYIFF